ncbi:hypothetical protein AB0L06_36250, partial [Spirillospora sp. NPDC052269]
SRPHWSLARLVDRLADQRRRLDELAFGDLEVRASVALGYHGLNPPQQQAFRVLGLVQVPDFAAWVLGPLLGIPVGEAEDLIEALIDAQLLEVARSDQGGRLRLRFHDLVLLYARECLAEETPRYRHDALARVSDAWLQLAGKAEARTYAGEHRGWGPVSVPVPGMFSGPVPGMASGSGLGSSAPSVYAGLSGFEMDEIVSDPLRWFDEERQGLNSAVAQACEAGLSVAAWGICHHLVEFFETRGQYGDWERTHGKALRLCLETGDAMGEATTRLGLARCLLHRDLDNALHEAGLALRAFQELGCHAAEAEALAAQASALRATGRHHDATTTLNHARDLARRTGNNLAAVRAERESALNDYEQGRNTEAIAAMGRSLDRATRNGMPHEQAVVMRYLAIIKREQGDHHEAFEPAGTESAFSQEPGESKSEALRLLTLGLSALSLGRPGAAPLIRSGLGLLTQLTMDVGEARTHSPNSPILLARVHSWLAEAFRMSGRDREAHASYLTARAIYREIGNRPAADDLDRLMAALEPAAERPVVERPVVERPVAER